MELIKTLLIYSGIIISGIIAIITTEALIRTIINLFKGK